VKLFEAELSEKTSLYRIDGVDYPVLLSVDHGTLMLRSYYGADFNFANTRYLQIGSCFETRSRLTLFSPRQDEGIARGRRELFVGEWVGILKFTRDARHSRRPHR
jgi:hypothetical protein